MSAGKLIVDRLKTVYFITDQTSIDGKTKMPFIKINGTFYPSIPKEILTKEVYDHYFSDNPKPFSKSIILDGKRMIIMYEPRD